MDRACVVGYGVVGQATAKLFNIRKHYDIQQEKSNISLKDVARTEYCFICLPSPNSGDGGYLLSPIVELIKQIEEYGSNCIYIIRTTVNPGFAKYLMDIIGTDKVISNPEFLSEDSAEKDTRFPPFVLLGGREGKYLQKVKGLYGSVIKSAPIILTDNTTAELAKLAMNAYFATKVIFANQIYDYSRKLGANYETVRAVLERHPFGPKNHFQVWFKGKRGVNGKCLPKDTTAFGHYSGLELIKKVVQLNEEYIYLKNEDQTV